MERSPSAEEFPVESELRFGAGDDRLHPWTHHADWAETVWFSFNAPERGLAGWLYTQVRPVLGTATGGAFVYDPSAHVPWELPFFAYTHHQLLPVPAEELNLADVHFKNGCSIKMVEPGLVYDLGFRFRDQSDFVATLRFEGLTPPVPHLQGAPPFTGSTHYDQHGHVTGEILLGGERIAIDCFAVRDRSWGRRPEHLGLGVSRLSYAFGTTPFWRSVFRIMGIRTRSRNLFPRDTSSATESSDAFELPDDTLNEIRTPGGSPGSNSNSRTSTAARSQLSAPWPLKCSSPPEVFASTPSSDLRHRISGWDGGKIRMCSPQPASLRYVAQAWPDPPHTQSASA